MGSILIIDDNDADIYISQYYLERSEFFNHIYSASDGQEAWELFEDFPPPKASHPKGFPPQIILLDINMPLMNGFDFLEKLTDKKLNEEPLIVIMLTSSNNDLDKKKAKKFPMVKDYFVKPLKEEGVEKLIKMLQ
ncbi:MAG: response regulator [Calditrichia bacterium]